MEFKLEVKKHQERVTELESTVKKLQHELNLSRESNSNADDQTSSENEVAAHADLTNDNQQQEQVNLLLC